MNLHRIIAAAAVPLALGGCLLLSSAAQAAPKCTAARPGASVDYPPTGCAVKVASTRVARGGKTTATGTGFTPGHVVQFWIYPPGILLTNGAVGPDGTVSKALQIPKNLPPGTYSLRIYDPVTKRMQTVEITIVGPGGKGTAAAAGGTSGSGTGFLPRTGSSMIVPLVGLGLAMLASGGVLLLVARQRHTPTT